jgi:chromosomal replication initiation ATPase DnaA
VTRQLAFPFPPRQTYAAADFLPAAANARALAWLQDPAKWPALRLGLFGAPGSGKTHLLHLFAARHGARLLPGEAVRQLIDLPPAGGLVIDDADALPEPQSLLHALNAAAERRLPVLLAGRNPPARWPVGLPDLASRLRATASVGLEQPDDALLRALLARLLADRQMRVDPQIQDYLLARLPRSAAAMREAACCLDRLSLAAGRRVTRALAADALARLGAVPEEETNNEVSAAEPPGTSPNEPRLL